MDIPEFLKTATLVLYERVYAHFIGCADTGEKDVDLVVEALEYVYSTHGCADKLPSSVELSEIVSRAYDVDVEVMMAIDEQQGITRPYPGGSLPAGQRYAYSSVVAALNGYLQLRSYGDSSEHVATPEDAQQYAGISRKFTAELSKAFLKEMDDHDEEMDEDDTEAFDALKKDFVSGLIDLASQTDASIIAKAAMPYKDTDDGRESFAMLKPYVNELLKYHRLP